MTKKLRHKSVQVDDLSSENRFELVKLVEELATKRSQSIWSTIKAIGVALVGTAAVGITTTLVNLEIQTTELELEKAITNRQLQDAERKLEQEYLKEFVNLALHPDLQRRIDFAQYVSSVTLNEEMQNLWKKYHSKLETALTDSRAGLKDKVSELEQNIEDGGEDSETIAALQGEIAALKRRVTPNSASRERTATVEIRRTANELLLEVSRGDRVGVFQTRFQYNCRIDTPSPGASRNGQDCRPRPAPNSLLVHRSGDDEFTLETMDLTIQFSVPEGRTAKFMLK